jgi:hypothetical protein
VGNRLIARQVQSASQVFRRPNSLLFHTEILAW